VDNIQSKQQPSGRLIFGIIPSVKIRGLVYA